MPIFVLWGFGVARAGTAPAAKASPPAPKVPAPAAKAPPRKVPATDVLTVAPTPTGAPIPSDYLGVSLEYNTVTAYEGAPPAGINPVFAQLIRNLTPNGTPLIRIGGDSTDWSWWPIAGMRRPPGVSNNLTAAWSAKAQALARSARARLILGINLEAGSGVIAADEARQLRTTIGPGLIDAFEVGNEPQLYPQLPWYRTATGVREVGRPRTYTLTDYGKEFATVAHALPHTALAGPAVGHSWVDQLRPFISTAPGLKLVTFHAYAINRTGAAFRGRNCSTPMSDLSHPTISALLAPFAGDGLTRELPPLVALAHRHGEKFRIDELNAITCAGMPGVSDTFASALWATNALFAIAQAGVDGVNVHTWRGSAGKLFGFTQTGNQWSATVRPEYYGLLMFELAAPAGSRLLPTAQSVGSLVDAWATRGRDNATRILFINHSLRQSQAIRFKAPGQTAGQVARVRPAQLTWLRAPGASATTGVTLGCQSFDPATTTGMLAGPACPGTLTPHTGTYALTVPAASAALVTIPPR